MKYISEPRALLHLHEELGRAGEKKEASMASTL